MHTISSYRGNRPTKTQTHAARPQTGPITITIHCASKLSTQCNEVKYNDLMRDAPSKYKEGKLNNNVHKT